MPAPIPEKKTPLNFAGTYSPAEFTIIKAGFKPQSMDGKWRVAFEEPWLYFRRSWTGYYVYGVRFCPKGPDFKVVESWSNADRAQVNSLGAQHDETMLKYLIEGFLLCKSIPLSVASGPPGEKWRALSMACSR